ncbi:MltA domain-containing protein [Brevundimonas sanguinis]|uniref:MltA domain-containing protein n=1 Tax=Brevundimonas sanguinis TaxID=3021811 RepID=UPI0024156DE2|nr:MltA domain-containing protein [Brevundimonas sp. NCCP 15609]
MVARSASLDQTGAARFLTAPLSWTGVAALTFLAAACASTPRPIPTPGPTPPVDQPTPPPVAGALNLAALPGWAEEDHLAALRAYAAGCGPSRIAVETCRDARALVARANPSDARAFLESRFAATEVQTDDGGRGLLTAYFAPEYPARRTPDAEFDAPVLSRPANLSSVGDRAAIEAGSAQSSVLAWMKAEDLFFLQIQGSGTLTFPDGARLRAAYAADNGAKFVGIARPMADEGLLPRDGTSGEAIRAWLAAHRGPEARRVMALNPRYIFFTTKPDDGDEATGAAGVPLPARRSVAVDPSRWTYGEAAWIEADGGNLRGARASYRGLVMTLDTGSAIRGPVRADLYIGRGDAAGHEAGAVRHPLRMWRLIPRG